MIKLIEIHKISATGDDSLMVDVTYSQDGVVDRVIYCYRESDEYGLVSKALTVWLSENEYVLEPFVPAPDPTPEEVRETLPPISKRQLRLTLSRNGINISELDTAIEAMGEEAVIEWQDATEYRRMHPLLIQVAEYLSLTPTQVDLMWQEAILA